MYNETMEELGLSPNEAKIYQTLLEVGEAGIGTIAVEAKIHRRNSYDAIERLIEKGLCFQVVSQGENKYSAVDPGKLRELLSEKQARLEEIMPQLERIYRNQTPTEEAYIYRGFEGLKNMWRDILRVGKDVHALGAKGSWFDPRVDAKSRKSFFESTNRKGVKFFELFDFEVKQKLSDFPKSFPGQIEYRFLPKEYSTKSGMVIFGEYIVSHTGLGLKTTNEKTLFFVIKSKDLAESYRTWFWYMWEQSEEPKKQPR